MMLERSWFERDAPVVASELLNKLLITTVADGAGAGAGSPVTRTSGRIIEVEAYMPDDPASHTFNGQTRRNGVMFGPAGHLYVYLSYGIHHCANVVTGNVGSGQAVLIRAVEPLDGIEAIRMRRGSVAERSLTDGPGKLTRALGIGLRHDAVDLVDGGSHDDAEISIVDDGCAPPKQPLTGPRIGISKGVDTPWRFRVPAIGRRSRIVSP